MIRRFVICSLFCLLGIAGVRAQQNALDADPDTVLIVRDSTLRLTNLQLETLATLPSGANPRVLDRQISRREGEALVSYSSDGTGRTVSSPPPVDAGDRLLDAAPAPDGSAIVWFYERCDSSARNCWDQQVNTLILTAADGSDPRLLWQGAPIDDVSTLILDGWRGSAVVLRHYAPPSVEPGADPGLNLGYSPEGSSFIVIAPDGSEQVYAPSNTEAAFSSDGSWFASDTGERFRRNVTANTLHVESQAGSAYDVPFDRDDRIFRLNFTPDNAYLTWMQESFTDGEVTRVVLLALDLTDGTVAELHDFGGATPEPIDWLSDRLLLLRGRDTLAVNVATGELIESVFPAASFVIAVVRP